MLQTLDASLKHSILGRYCNIIVTLSSVKSTLEAYLIMLWDFSKI